MQENSALSRFMRATVPDEGSSEDGEASTLGSVIMPGGADRLRAAWR